MLLDPLAVFAVALRQRRRALPQRTIGLSTVDCDHRLVGEYLQKLDLRLRELARLSPCNIDRTDRVSVPHQGNGGLSTNGSPECAFSQRIGLIGRDVG